MPWQGFINKALNCDVFVLLDCVQFEKNYFQNRNRIISKISDESWAWITVPVRKGQLKELINQKRIAFTPRDRRKYLKRIGASYSNCPQFKSIYPLVERLIDTDYNTIAELNSNLIIELFNILEIKTKVIVASSLDLGEVEANGAVVYQICDRLVANMYLSGKSGRDYLDERPFLDAGIKITYQDFQPVAYEQITQKFIPGLSVLDLLFMKEPIEAKAIIGKGFSV